MAVKILRDGESDINIMLIRKDRINVVFGNFVVDLNIDLTIHDLVFNPEDYDFNIVVYLKTGEEHLAIFLDKDKPMSMTHAINTLCNPVGLKSTDIETNAILGGYHDFVVSINNMQIYNYIKSTHANQFNTKYTTTSENLCKRLSDLKSPDGNRISKILSIAIKALRDNSVDIFQ